MKKVMLLVLTLMIVSAFLIAAMPAARQARLITTNKSGSELALKLEHTTMNIPAYYFPIEVGTRLKPTVQNWDVYPGEYFYTVEYLEDPLAMGCVPNLVSDEKDKYDKTPIVNIRGKSKVTFTECYAPFHKGEPGAWKFPSFDYIYRNVKASVQTLYDYYDVDFGY